MKRIILTALMLLSVSVFSAEAEIKIPDNNPQPGKSINIVVERNGNASEQVMSIVLYSYNSKNNLPEISEKKILLSTTDRNIATIMSVPSDAQFVVIKSHTEGADFEKNESLPLLMFSAEGIPVVNTYYFKSLYDISGLSRIDDSPVDYSESQKDLAQELKAHPENNLAKLASISLAYDMKQVSKDSVIAELEPFRKNSESLGDKEANTLLKLYTSIDYSKFADSLAVKIAAKNPTGSIAEQKFIETLNKKDSNEYINLSDMFQRQFPNSEYIPEIKSKCISICMQSGQYDRAEALLKKENFNPPTQALYLAFIYLEKENSRAKAEKLFGEAVSGLKSLLGNNKSKSMTNYEWDNSVTANLAEVYRAMGEYWLQLKNEDSSIKYFKLAQAAYKTKPAKIYENLTQAYYIFRRDKEAFAESEEAILASAGNVKILDINEKLFPKQKIKQKYQDYLDSINEIATARRMEKISGGMISKNIKLPVLQNIDNLAIDLKIFKGDITVIDLFATWCQPCETGLSALVNISKTKYLSDKITFLAVDCLENSEPDKSAFKSEDFGRISILFDKDNSFSRSLGIKGLPTRLFFDREGKLRYIIRGASGEEEDTRETEDVINILLKQ